jgi:hypothetical protein
MKGLLILGAIVGGIWWLSRRNSGILPEVELSEDEYKAQYVLSGAYTRRVAAGLPVLSPEESWLLYSRSNTV